MGLKRVYMSNEEENVLFWVNGDNGAISVDILKINGYSLVGNKKRYRVDFRGHTILSNVTLGEAKKKAKEILKPFR